MKLLAVWLALAIAAPVTPSPEDRASARALFEEAVVAKRESRWPDVRRLLERALELYPQFSTAWNLVTAEEQLDDSPAAEALLLRMREDAFGALSAKERTAVDERLASVTRELGTINLEAGEPEASIEVDGKPRGNADVTGKASLRVPAGSHVVAVTRRDGRTLDRSLDVERGEQRTLHFSFPAPNAVLEAKTPAPVVEAEPSPPTWLWIGIGAVVLVGAAVVVTAVIANQDADPLPADFVAPPL